MTNKNNHNRIELDVHVPTVVVYGNGHTNGNTFHTEVYRALQRADVDCLVLDGSAAAADSSHTQTLAASDESAVQYSVILPVCNEEETVVEIYRRLTAVMAGLAEPYELIFVDDGSRDRSLELIRELHAYDPEHVCSLVLSRNFGHQRAVSAGIHQARGQAVIVMDADLQDPPEVIPQFIEKWQQGFEVVYAIREKRKENVAKRVMYHGFYLILRAFSRIEIPLDAGDFCLMDRGVVDALALLPERNRFVRGLRSWVGFKQVGLVYARDARFAGTSKYTFRKLVGLALDGLISFSYVPLRLASTLGLVVSLLSLVAAAYYFFKAITVGLRPPGFATLVVLVTFLGGIQLITIGVVGEYIGHVLDEVKARPTYLIREVLSRQEVKN